VVGYRARAATGKPYRCGHCKGAGFKHGPTAHRADVPRS
jgi:hypothetical protein